MLYRFIPMQLLLLSTLVVLAPAIADTGNFIQQRALGPIKQQTGLPEAASRLISTNELQLSLVHNNVFVGGQTSSERLILDGESSQLSLRYRRRVNSCWQINVSGVLLSHSDGQFDKPLDAWHQFFGLPDAQRDEWPNNELQYVYENGDGRQAITTPNHGVGDAQVQLQHSIGCARNSTIVRFGMKLPFGDPAKFNGNGAVDAFVDVQSSWHRSKRFTGLLWAGSVGLLGTGTSDQPTEQKRLAGFGTVGLNYALNSRTQLLTQLDWHTPLFKSELRELAASSVQLSIGLRYQTRNKGVWELSFSEDAVIDTVPDIAVRLAWVSRFDNR